MIMVKQMNEDLLARIAYINAQVTCATITAMGMAAENEQRKLCGESMAYVADDFINLIDKYGIGHNSIVDDLFRR